MNKFMFCPCCLHSICIPSKFECFICLESKRNKFMPMGDNLFAAKLKYLQRGSGCCKKKRKKVDKVDIIKNPSSPIFFSLKQGILIRNYLGNPIKMVPMLYNDDFWHKLVVFIVKKVNGKEVDIFSFSFFILKLLSFLNEKR